MVFDIQDTIHKLRTYNNSRYLILSIYLDVPENNPNISQYLFDTFTKSLKRTLSKRDRNMLLDDIDYIGAYLKQYRNTHNYRGIALFSGGNKLWEVINTQFKLRNSLMVNHSAYLEPLMIELATYERYLVVLTDREKARMFTILNGRVEAEKTIHDPSVPQEIKGSSSQAMHAGRDDKIARHIQEHLHRHLKLISEKITEFIGHKQISGVIVGGHDTLIHKTEEYLPDPLKRKVVAEFISELNVSLGDLAARSTEIIRNIHHQISPQQFKGSLIRN